MKKKYSYRELLFRLLILLTGLTIAHLGVTLFLLANLGSDPFNVFVQGVFCIVKTATGLPRITHGQVHICICFIIILVLLILDRSYVKIGTIVCMVCGGPIIDFFNIVLSPLFSGDVSITVRIMVNILGCAVLAYGMTIVIKSKAGTGPNDLIAIVLADKLKKKFSILRVIVDLIFAATGYLMGGTIGIGTLICAFVVGPIAGLVMPVNERLINRILKKIR